MLLALALNLSLLAIGAVASTVIAVGQPAKTLASLYPFLFGHWIVMGAREYGIIAILAVLMVGISIGLAKAYQSAPPTIIATFDYSYLLFSVFWSFVLFAEVPDAATIIGMLMIAGAGLLVIRRGKRPQASLSELVHRRGKMV
jgi:drug/metabolite transporter (DMT)-like permease